MEPLRSIYNIYIYIAATLGELHFGRTALYRGAWVLFRLGFGYHGSLCSYKVHSGPELVAVIIYIWHNYGCCSGVAVKRGSTVYCNMHIFKVSDFKNLAKTQSLFLKSSL